MLHVRVGYVLILSNNAMLGVFNTVKCWFDIYNKHCKEKKKYLHAMLVNWGKIVCHKHWDN